MSELIELESKIAYLENTINELSDVLYRQQQSIELLEKHYGELKESYLSIADSGGEAANEKPPHY